ncbi:hypothetical protein YC2023_112264 [Brassica napus]
MDAACHGSRIFPGRYETCLLYLFNRYELCNLCLITCCSCLILCGKKVGNRAQTVVNLTQSPAVKPPQEISQEASALVRFDYGSPSNFEEPLL